MRLRACAVAAVGAAALASCGGEDEPASASDQIRTLFADMSEALDDKDYGRACGLLTEVAREELAERGSCDDVLGRTLAAAGDRDVIPSEVREIDFESGGRAMVRSPDKKQTKVRREGSDWRFASDKDW